MQEANESVTHECHAATLRRSIDERYYLLLSPPVLRHHHSLIPQLRAAERALVVFETDEMNLAKVDVHFVLIAKRWHTVEVETLFHKRLDVTRVDVEVLQQI